MNNLCSWFNCTDQDSLISLKIVNATISSNMIDFDKAEINLEFALDINGTTCQPRDSLYLLPWSLEHEKSLSSLRVRDSNNYAIDQCGGPYKPKIEIHPRLSTGRYMVYYLRPNAQQGSFKVLAWTEQSLQVDILDLSEISSQNSIPVITAPKTNNLNNQALPQHDLKNLSQFNSSQNSNPCGNLLEKVFAGRPVMGDNINLMESQLSQKMRQRNDHNRNKVTIVLLSSGGQPLMKPAQKIM